MEQQSMIKCHYTGYSTICGFFIFYLRTLMLVSVLLFLPCVDVTANERPEIIKIIQLLVFLLSSTRAYGTSNKRSELRQ